MEERVLNVLLVEDDPDDVFLLRKTLDEVARDKFNLRVAARLSEALELAAQQHFDAVLLDLSLPDSHGLETFSEVHARIPEVPVVVLTGLDDEEVAVRAVHEGAQDYLVKGQGDGALLVRSLRYAIERQRTIRYQALLVERERFDAAISQMTDGIVVTDGEGRITTANHAACLLLNLPAAQGKGSLLEVALAPFTLSLAAPELMVLPEPVTAFEISRPHTRPPLFLDARLTRLFDDNGALASTVLVLRDVTDERHARHVQTNFFLLVSHKLRTPLSVLVGYLDLLKRLPKEELLGEWDHIVQVLDREVRRLHEMVQRLLEFKELSARELEAEAERADVVAVVAGATAEIRRRYPDCKLNITSQISGDADRADMSAEDAGFVLEQLLDNAVKFADKEPVEIRIRVEPEEDRLRVSVTDNGRGIPHEYFDRIFSGFVQVEDHATGQVPGLGIGLHMARKVVEAYGGEITVESRLGEGSTFSCTFPAVKQLEEA
jgi:signal transduction histidine kinase